MLWFLGFLQFNTRYDFLIIYFNFGSFNQDVSMQFSFQFKVWVFLIYLNLKVVIEMFSCDFYLSKFLLVSKVIYENIIYWFVISINFLLWIFYILINLNITFISILISESITVFTFSLVNKMIYNFFLSFIAVGFAINFLPWIFLHFTNFNFKYKNNWQVVDFSNI